jgi:hypothetical protein
MRRHRANKGIQRGLQQTLKWNNTIKTEIYELKKATQNIKEELNKDMENSEKKELSTNPGN